MVEKYNQSDGHKFKLWTDDDYKKLNKIKITLYKDKRNWNEPNKVHEALLRLNKPLEKGFFEFRPTNIFIKDREKDTGVIKDILARDHVFFIDDVNLEYMRSIDMCLKYGVESLVFRAAT